MPGIYMVMGDTAEVVAKRYTSPGRPGPLLAPEPQRTAAPSRKGSSRKRWRRCTSGAAFSTSRRARSSARSLLRREGRVQPRDTTLSRSHEAAAALDKDSGKAPSPRQSSQLSDGASATLVMSMTAQGPGIRPSSSSALRVAGCEPTRWASVRCTPVPKLLKRHGLKIRDIDVWELNEAFASQVVYCRDRLGLDSREAQHQRRLISIGIPSA